MLCSCHGSTDSVLVSCFTLAHRYKGEGRVAQKGNVDPKWVDGELLHFAVGASPLTGGAELGFVFVVPNERRFLILLNKIDLAAFPDKKSS